MDLLKRNAITQNADIDGGLERDAEDIGADEDVGVQCRLQQRLLCLRKERRWHLHHDEQRPGWSLDRRDRARRRSGLQLADHRPTVKRVVQVNQKILARYVGAYALSPNRDILDIGVAKAGGDDASHTHHRCRDNPNTVLSRSKMP